MPMFPPNSWVPVDDWKPKANMQVLGWWHSEPTISYMDEHMQWWYTKHNVDGYRRAMPPSHWMKITGPNGEA